MGLDGYLYARIDAPKGSMLADIVEKHLPVVAFTDRDGEEWTFEKTLDKRYGDEPEDFLGDLYVGGWEFMRKDGTPNNEAKFYDDLVKASGMTPDEGSPHFYVSRDGDGGYVVKPTIIYWRKANAIHRWFVDYTQDGVDECQYTNVHSESLMDLLDRCEQVSASPSSARELLPSQGGFFFGSTDYDEWYFRDVKETAEKIRRQVAAVPAGSGFAYRSSW